MLARTRDVLLLSLTLLFANLMYGQGGANGTILGTVTDNSGAVVAGANVDVTIPRRMSQATRKQPRRATSRFHSSRPAPIPSPCRRLDSRNPLRTLFRS